MKLDLKDKEVKDEVDRLIAEALEAQASEHEADVKGLKEKNTQLLAKNKELRTGRGDPESSEKLEADLERVTAENKELAKKLGKIEKERDTFKATAETETQTSRKYFIDNSLTDALNGANVGKQFLPAVKGLLAGKVEIKVDGENRTALVDGKPLGEFVKTWSQGDEGKHYIVAPANGGGGAPGAKGGGSGNGKTMVRSQFVSMNPKAQADYMREGGTLTEG